MVFLDLTKAFDTVCHKRLLIKLEHYGIRGNALNLLSSYLSNRMQFVAINNHFSSLQPVSMGVPQGSILGPLLFLLYINDIPNAINGIPRLFADDTCLSVKSATPESLEGLLNSDLHNVMLWATANRLTINPTKSQAIVISPKLNSSSPILKLMINSSNIAIADCVKYLGVYIDNKLNFREHINILESKVSRSVGILCKLKHYVPYKSLQQVYFALIHSQLFYVLLIWGATYKTYLSSLISLQNKAIKIISGAHWQDSAKPCYKKLMILNLNQLLTFETAKFMYKYTKNSLPETFTNYFSYVKDIHDRNTRSSAIPNQLYIPKYRSSRLQRTIKYRGVKVWNDIDSDLQNFSFHTFKKLIKKVLI